MMLNNEELSLEEFENICNIACRLMNEKAEREPEYYLTKGGQKLEKEVKDALDAAAKGTSFEGTIEIISGQKFPDIVAAKRYGVEVKSTKEDKWTLIGGSVAEGTRVEGVEHIFILFGKLHKPAEFRTRRYEECLYDIAVTHSPRYKIDMNLPAGETIFDKMSTSYSEMQSLKNPIEPVVEYFRSTLKPGESLWWVNGEEAASGAVPAKIRMWNTLPKEEKRDLIAQGFVLFPELFSDDRNKYERFTLWLVAKHGVVLSNRRDPFSAGGQGDLEINGVHYEKLPKKYIQLSLYKNAVKDVILKSEEDVLRTTWEKEETGLDQRMKTWMELVAHYAEKEEFNVSGLLKDMFESEDE